MNLPNAVELLRAQYPSLPTDYLEFLASSPEGVEGELAVNPYSAIIWPAEEALVASSEYEVDNYLPGYFVFGGSGGGELFVLSLNGQDDTVYYVPAIGMDPKYLSSIADSFRAFAESVRGG